MRSLSTKFAQTIGARDRHISSLRQFPFPVHGYIGMAVILIAEILLFSGNRFVGGWFTPIVWTGYILFSDALLYMVKGRSLLVTDRLELLAIMFVSVIGWWLFEFYNAPRFWRSELELWWHYHNLETNPYLRRFGYDWAFATISAALFLTAQLFAAILFYRLRGFRPIRFRRPLLYLSMTLGTAGVIVPIFVISQWFAPVIWLSFTLLLDPLNFLRGSPSIVGDLQEGNYQRLASLLASGAICGFLWEFWNYWAISRWSYTVPYFGDVKLFEMPILGYLGFPPFAVECWVMYIFFRSLLTSRPMRTHEIWIESSDADK
ncbi:MAG TPA: hypothetical protein VJ180_15780 [Pyrinomonadaceae bacterium]|nr:hypothetical protein [Pyrinomonadaceae bacterium]